MTVSSLDEVIDGLPLERFSNTCTLRDPTGRLPVTDLVRRPMLARGICEDWPSVGFVILSRSILGQESSLSCNVVWSG